jgi:uridylate kinase
MPIMVFNLFDNSQLEKAIDGEDVGTYVSNENQTVFA